MKNFKCGDKVYSKEYGGFWRIKHIARSKCSIETDKPVLGSTVKITLLSALIPAENFGANNERGKVEC